MHTTKTPTEARLRRFQAVWYAIPVGPLLRKFDEGVQLWIQDRLTSGEIEVVFERYQVDLADVRVLI